MLTKVRRALKNVYVFSILSRVVMVGVGFLYSILLARYLGTELKGQLTYINTITAITVIVCSFGMHQAYPYYRKQGTEGIGRTYGHICFLALGGYIVIAAIAAAIVGNRDARVTWAIALTPLLTFTKLVTYRVMVDDPNRKNAWEVVCELLEAAALALLLLFAPRNLTFAIAVLAGKNLISCVYYLRASGADLRITREDRAMLRRFAAFGFLPMLSLLMNNLNYRIDVLMLGASVTDEQIGIYSVGIQIAEKVWLVSDALRDALFSKLIGGRDAEEVNKVIRICFTISLVIDLAIIAVGAPFIRICYGAEYAGAYEPLVIVLFGTLVMVFYKIIQTYNIVHKKQKLNFIFLAASVVANVILNAVLIPLWGINGAAAASLISYSVCAFLFVFEYTRATGSKIRDLLILNREDLATIRKIGGKTNQQKG